MNRTKGCASYRATKHEITLSIVDICLLKVCNNSGELSSPVANSNFLKNRLKNSATIAPSKQCNQALSSILYIRYTIQVIAPLVRVLHGTNMTQTQQCVAWSIYTKQTPQWGEIYVALSVVFTILDILFGFYITIDFVSIVTHFPMVSVHFVG